MDQIIQSKLAIQVAQLSLDKATLEAQVELLQQEKQELLAALDQATAPANQTEGEEHDNISQG